MLEGLLQPELGLEEPAFLMPRVMRTFKPGREATMSEVHISAVHITAATISWSALEISHKRHRLPYLHHCRSNRSLRPYKS